MEHLSLALLVVSMRPSRATRSPKTAAHAQADAPGRFMRRSLVHQPESAFFIAPRAWAADGLL